MSKSLNVEVAGKQFSFVFVVSDARRLKNGGFDIMDPKKYKRLFDDIVSQMDVLTEFAMPQLQLHGMTEETFLDAISADHGKYGECFDAFIEGIKNFFLNLRQDARAKVIEKAQNAMNLAEQRMLNKLNDPKVDQILEREMSNAEREADKELDRLLSGGISSTVPE